MKKKFIYDGDTTICIINNKYIGKTVCDPEDLDFKNNYTGAQIAEAKAMLKYLYKLKKELRSKLRVLESFEKSIKGNLKYNQFSYESLAFKKHKQEYEDRYLAAAQAYEEINQMYHDFIQDKDILYKKLRKNRASQKD